MRIIAIYVEEFKILKHLMFGLDANFVCTFDKGVFSINYSQRLPRDFFSMGELPDRRLFVSGIVGENGSGKTSFASLLQNLSDSKDGGLKCLVFLEDESGYHVYGRGLSADIKVNKGSENPDALNQLSGRKSEGFPRGGFAEYSKGNVEVVYYSPIYTTQHPFDLVDGAFRDVSTTRLIKHPDGENEDAVAYGIPRDEMFDAAETRRVLEFLQLYREKIEKKELDDTKSIEMPNPVGIIITDHANQRSLLFAEFDERRKSLGETMNDLGAMIDNPPVVISGGDASGRTWDGFISSVGELYTCLDNLARRAHNGSLFVRVFLCYLLELCATDEILDVANPQDVVAGRLCQKCEELFGGDTPESNYQQKLIEYLRLSGDGRLKLAADVFELLDGSHDLGERYFGGIRCSFANKGAIKNLMELVKLHAIAKNALNPKTARDFIRFEFDPKVSSGEWAFLSAMSRVNDVLKRSASDLIVFLDEAETTLHPRWQRQLVRNMLWFFRNFAGGRKVHLIFASHSPVLLSDIPMGNVTFLKRKDKTDNANLPGVEVVSVINPRLGFTDTFGANIFDLYNLSFFMKEGTVGAFAADKMESILKDDNTAKEERLQLLRLVGDPFLRGYYADELRELGVLEDNDGDA